MPESKIITNRLVHEKSPYLLQHAGNPVDWYPWGRDAFARAQEEDRPVFLSVGYSTCHWCHVMAHESFEDQEIARLLNETCVSIKVDREERPDIDKVYMTACQMLTGRGGWPLTIVMTPEGKPFFAATYIPREGRFATAGMRELIPTIKDAWHTRRGDVVRTAEEITGRMKQLEERSQEGPFVPELITQAYRDLLGIYDDRYGGFGKAPKFPVPHNIVFLLRTFRRSGERKALEMAVQTLRAMRRGGIYDHIGFGFHRYSTDQQWLVPHFEKMLYDQALICQAYMEVFAVTGNEEWGKTAREILDYVLRDMTLPEGGFCAAEDADSEGKEGLFYLWTIEEMEELLSPEEARMVVKDFNLEKSGNFAEEATGGRTGRNILHLTEDIARTAASLNVSEGDLLLRLEGARKKLFAARSRRIHPLRDDKILTDWNGLMIAALARGARLFQEEIYWEAASSAVNFIRGHMYGNDGRLLHRWREGEAAFPANLDDYAFLIWGLIECYETFAQKETLAFAFELQETLDKLFWDAKREGYFFTPADAELLLFRPKDVYDGALPSGNSVSVMNLCRLGKLAGREELLQKAGHIARAFAGEIQKSPASFTQFLIAADMLGDYVAAQSP